MPKLRVLIVDDALAIRHLLSNAMSQDPQLEVAGTAINGNVALQRFQQVKPDVIILDVDMPELDGISTLREIRKRDRKVPVIMFSALTEKGAETAVEALISGASDCVGKPTDLGSMAEATHWLQRELIPKIKAHCRHLLPPDTATSAGELASAPLPPARLNAPRRIHKTPIHIVAIGVSTGGPNALVEIFSNFKTPLPVPMVIVQHMPPLFTRRLADSLNGLKSRTIFHEGEEGMVVESGHAYIAPGGKHMLVRREGTRTFLRLEEGPPENSCRPAVDVLFRSVSSVYGASTLAVILTGMGMDGLRGCEVIHAAGGRILVQDEASSVVWGMPGFIARAGLADEVIPLNQISGRMIQLFQLHAGALGAAGAVAASAANPTF